MNLQTEKKIELDNTSLITKYIIKEKMTDITLHIYIILTATITMGGDLKILINQIEEKYNYKDVKKFYKSNVSVINDALYIYDRLPFITSIRCLYYNNESMLEAMDYISVEDIKEYIKENNVKLLNTNNNLSNMNNWII